MQERADSGSICEELSNGSMIQGNAIRTPNFRAIPNDFVAKRTSCSRALDLSPIPDNFANMADEDLWLQLNKGCTTNLDMLQMTPNMHHSVSSTNTSLVSYTYDYLQSYYACIFCMNFLISTETLFLFDKYQQLPS